MLPDSSPSLLNGREAFGWRQGGEVTFFRERSERSIWARDTSTSQVSICWMFLNFLIPIVEVALTNSVWEFGFVHTTATIMQVFYVLQSSRTDVTVCVNERSLAVCVFMLVDLSKRQASAASRC